MRLGPTVPGPRVAGQGYTIKGSSLRKTFFCSSFKHTMLSVSSCCSFQVTSEKYAAAVKLAQARQAVNKTI